MRRLLALLVLTACAEEAPEETRIVSGDHEIAISPDKKSFTLRRGPEELLSFSAEEFEAGVVRARDPNLSWDPYWLEHEDELFAFEPPEDLRFLPNVEHTIEANGEDRFVLRLVPKVPNGEVGWIRFRVRVKDDDRFYGLGEWPDRVEHRGTLRPMQIEPELSLEGASNEAHVPVPLVIGTKGWGLFVKSKRPGLFDLTKKHRDRIEITYGTAEESDKGLEVHLFGAARPIDLTKHYYAVTDLPRLPAPWAYGPWIWRNESRDQAEVEEDIAMIRDLDLPTSAIWIDRPYATKVESFDFDPVRFPDPRAMITKAKENGLHVALWHAPYLEDGAEPFRTTAVSEGYFPPKSGLLLNRWGEPIDFTNPAAYAFWQTSLRRYIELGIEGFKLDYAEDVALGIAGGSSGWRFFDGSDERTMHHDYTILYHRAYAELFEEEAGFLLCRAGRWGDQAQGCVIWPGDMDATFDRHGDQNPDYKAVGGLPATVIQGLGLGPSGFPLFASDTGGYRHSPPDDETFTRWFEQTALSAVMEVGDASSEPPWVRGASTLDLYRTYARLHLRLFPYVWSYAKRLKDDGRAIVRPIGLVHPELGEHPDDEYLLGDHLLVAPVVTRGAHTKRVILPPGEWVDWWTGERHVGPGAIEVDAPLEVLPLFLSSAAAVPLLPPSARTLTPIESAIHWRLTGGGSGEFTIWDGTRIVQKSDGIELTDGSQFHAVEIELISTPSAPSTVLADGAPIDTWRHDPNLAGGTLVITLRGSPKKVEAR
jgi:alpha-D-xyloside xylohydrolase